MTFENQDIDNNVLFQKIGNTWYIFTEIDNEFVYSAMPEGMDPRNTKLEIYHVIEEHLRTVAGSEKKPLAEAAQT